MPIDFGAPFDPFAHLAGPRQGPAFPALSPEEEESLLSGLGRKALSGLAYVGQTLDKPGRALRGLLGGKPEALANLIPFSDTLGITDPANDVSGRNLLENLGLFEKGVPGSGIDVGDVAGFLTDVFTNPLTALGGGALTQAGKTAKMAGTLEKSLLGRMTAAGGAQGGLAKLGVPFTPLQAVVGTGPTAQKIAGGLGAASDWLGATSPMLHLKALFNKGAQGATTEDLQSVLMAKNAGLAAKEQPALSAIDRVQRDLYNRSQLNVPASDQIRMGLEGGLSPLPGTPQGQALGQAIGGVRNILEPMPLESSMLGRDVTARDLYATRQVSDLAGRPSKGYSGVPLNPKTVFEKQREALYDLPIAASEGDKLVLPGQFQPTNTVNQILKDEELRSLAPDVARSKVFQQWLGGNQGDLSTLQAARQAAPIDPAEAMKLVHLEASGASKGTVKAAQLAAQKAAFGAANPDAAVKLGVLEELWDKSRGLVNRAKTLDPRYAEQGQNFFGNDIFTDVRSRALAHVRSTENMNAFHDAMTNAATDASSAGPDSVPLWKVYDKIGMTGEGADATAIGKLLGNGKLPSHLNPQDMEAAYKDLHVPAKLADDLTRVVQGFREPEAMSGLLKGIDNFTSLFRVGNVTPWPARYIRNSIVQESWNRFVHGIKNPEYAWADPRAWFKSPVEAEGMLSRGGTVSDYSKIPGLANMTPKEATDEILNKAVGWKIIGPDALPRNYEVVGDQAFQHGLQIPGMPQKPLLNLGAGGKGSVLAEAIPGTMEQAKPWNLTGIGGRTQTGFAPAVAGQQIDKRLDEAMRLGSFVDSLRQGYGWKEAAERVNLAHYDYTNLSGFEKSVMRRAMPFYNWTRQNMPAVLRQITEEPGGLTAQGFKASAAARQKEGFEPPYIAETLGIPWGGRDNGTQRYLTTAGLPFEDALSHLVTGQGGVSGNVARSGESVMSEMNPLLKGPAELFTHRQFYSGRDMADLSTHGLTGSPLLDQAIMNSPFSRLARMGSTLSDERKGLGGLATNLLSPARVNDVDVESAKRTAGRELLDRAMQNSPDLQAIRPIFHVPQDKLANMTPEEVALMRLQTNLLQEQKQAGLEYRAAQGDPKAKQQLLKARKIGIR